MATKEQLKEWIVSNQDKQGKEGKDGQDFEKVKQKYISLKASGGTSEAVDYDKNTERLRTAAQGLTLGFGDEIEAGVRSIGSDDSYETIRDRIRGRLNQYSSDNPGEALGIEMAGSLVIPGGVARTAAVKGGKMALGKVAGYNAGLGAGYGAGMSEGENASEIAADATLGGAIGGVGGAGLQAISRNFRPLIQKGAREQAQRALDSGGGYITRGQAIGGGSKKLEDSLSNVMPSIKAAQTDGLKGFNVEVIDNIFKKATKEMPDEVIENLNKKFLSAANSEQQIKVINEAVDTAYDLAFTGGKSGVPLKFTRDKVMNQELTEWLNNASQNATKSEIAVLKSLKSQFLQRIGKGKVGQQAKNVQKTLKDNAQRAKNNTDSNIANTYDAQAELTKLFQRTVARQNNPQQVKLLKSIEGSYGDVTNLRKLLAATSNKDAFTVADAARFFTQSNAKTQQTKINNKAQMKVSNELKDLINPDTRALFKSTTGDSGTGAGLMSIGTIASMGGLVGSGAIMNPAVIGAITAIGLKAFQYSPFMLKRFNKMIANNDYRKAAKMIEQYGAQSGAAGLLSNESVESYQQ